VEEGGTFYGNIALDWLMTGSGNDTSHSMRYGEV